MVQDSAPPPPRYVPKFAKSSRRRFKSRYSRVKPKAGALCQAWLDAAYFKVLYEGAEWTTPDHIDFGDD